MKKILLLGTLFFYLYQSVIAQPSLRQIRKKSWTTRVYRISADTAEKYVTKGIKAADQYLNQPAFTTFPSDWIDYEELPVGHYVLITVLDNELEVEYYGSTRLQPFVINNQHRAQIVVRDREGTPYSNAKIWVDSKEAKFNATSLTYQIKQKKPEDEIVKIIVPGDTVFARFAVMKENYKTPWQQRWGRFRSSRVGRVVTWLPYKIRNFIKNKPRNWFRKRYRYRRPEGRGYMIFSKPKYFPDDTVKFKACVMNKKGKQYNKSLYAFLEYTDKGTPVTKQLSVLKPVSGGAYVHQFLTADTLRNDTRFDILLKNRKGKTLLRNDFYIEDYLLDEVAEYKLESVKEKYFAGDTLRFLASAKDANGLPLMDGRVKFYLLSQGIDKFYKKREFVPDTLWQEEKPMAIDGDTKFAIPSTLFPKTDMNIKALAVFLNSNNEIQEEDQQVKFRSSEQTIDIRETNGVLTAIFYENGKPVIKKGWMETDVDEIEKPIEFPYTAKVDPHAGNYEFYTEDAKGKIEVFKDYDIDEDYRVTFNRAQEKDTVAFVLANPKRIPVYYSIFDHNKEIANASGSDEWITWKGRVPGGKLYTVKWQYYWAGEEKHENESIGLLTKLMTSEIKSAAIVYPGQTDTITITVKDYKQREASKVNLTAVSYNTQFGKDISVPEPPYIQRFRGKSPILHDWYETEKAEVTKRFLLGLHQGWRPTFGLDTMPYYKFLFPGNGFHMVRTQIQNLLPQVAVFAVQKGVPQEIYLIYINRELVYYNGVTDKSVNAFTQYPGYVQIGIRTKDKYIETDSIYLQPYYKHDIVFDLDKLSPKAVVTPMNDYWTYREKELLDDKILRVENNYRNNNGYVWQGDRLVFLGTNGEHTAGPFSVNDSIQFYKPGDFDFKFYFEPGYRYRVTPQMVRLEKKHIFSDAVKTYLPSTSTPWILGDTVLAPPEISYNRLSRQPVLEQYGVNSYHSSYTLSKIFIQLPKDSSIAFTILYQDTVSAYKVLWGGVSNIYNIAPGNYNVVLVTNHFNFLEAGNIVVSKTGTYCVGFPEPVYTPSNWFVDLLLEKRYRRKMEEEALFRKKMEDEIERNNAARTPEMIMPPGSGMITGKVTDDKGGDPIAGTSVMVKGYRTATVCRPDGTFMLNNIREGKYVLQFSMVGYETKEKRVDVYEGENAVVMVSLNTSVNYLEEVVVIGYGTVRKRDLTSSVSIVRAESLTNVLMGRVSGLTVSGESNMIFADTAKIRIRGNATLNSSNQPLIIIDGVPVDEMPADLDSSAIASITTLKDATALTLYGSRAANGVIIINTKGFDPKMLREDFRDYAVWQPNLVTDNNGEAKFTVTYPDNITSWQTYVVGMDKKRRITKAMKLVRSFKPMMAQLSGPQFLIAGDSASLTGKKINYTNSPIEIDVNFSVNGKNILQQKEILEANNSSISQLGVIADAETDTIKAKFTAKSAMGFADGELRQIPVLRKGTTETVGSFYVLEKDTSVAFASQPFAGEVKLYAQNNTLELLLDEIEYLKKYPYFCMEQTASKLTGLAMEKKIRSALNQPFKNEKSLQTLITKLQKGQLFEGGWSWWEGGRANLMITNYVTRALLELRGNALLESNIRNALLYLQNQLYRLRRYELLETLFTLSEAKHDMDYNSYLRYIPFDSISLHQQWQMVSILQQQKLPYEAELQKLMTKQVATMTGGLHWGEDGYWWDRNEIATTVLAFKTLGRIGNHTAETKRMIQFFLERRKQGHWRNTVESATILSAIIPSKLEENTNFSQPAGLKISGDTTFTVRQFPFTTTLDKNFKNLLVSKSGGGLVYFTAYQEIFNPSPAVVDTNFRINSYFENNISTVTTLKAGERVRMKVVVDVLKDADFVQVEIPIPAGCTYGKKGGDNWNEHREYFKDRLMIFAEKLDKGRHVYEIDLEPRYPGRYTINPAKAELMYFPTFYGRNGISGIEITR
jgi:TonB-dependent SusC/RagA subfamily outer membrane receptor